MSIDLALAKQQCRVDGDEEDALITAYLAAAVAWVENFTDKLLTRREVEQVEDRFHSPLPLMRGPLPDEIAIEYIDADGVVQEITDASLVGPRLFYPAGWPSVAPATEVTVRYTAGFVETPGDLDAAVLLLVGEYYANREAGVCSPATTAAVEALCRPYRSVRV